MNDKTAPPPVDDLLRRLPFFSGIGEKEMALLKRGLREVPFEKGKVLFLEGDPCPGLYIVKSGQIRIFKTSPDGREQVLFIARPGSTFNDVPIFDGGPNPASASAMEDSTVYIVSTDSVLSLIEACPAARVIIKSLGARLRHLTMLVEDLSFRRVVSRLAKMLLESAEAEQPRRITQDEMAAMVGTARDVVGRSLRALEKEGAIRMERQRIVVVDKRKLKDLI